MKMCKQDPSILHTEEMHFLKEWVESMEGKILPATPKTKSRENIKKEKTDSKKAEENITIKTNHQVRKVVYKLTVKL